MTAIYLVGGPADGDVVGWHGGETYAASIAPRLPAVSAIGQPVEMMTVKVETAIYRYDRTLSVFLDRRVFKYVGTN